MKFRFLKTDDDKEVDIVLMFHNDITDDVYLYSLSGVGVYCFHIRPYIERPAFDGAI